MLWSGQVAFWSGQVKFWSTWPTGQVASKINVEPWASWYLLSLGRYPLDRWRSRLIFASVEWKFQAGCPIGQVFFVSKLSNMSEIASYSYSFLRIPETFARYQVFHLLIFDWLVMARTWTVTDKKILATFRKSYNVRHLKIFLAINLQSKALHYLQYANKIIYLLRIS